MKELIKKFLFKLFEEEFNELAKELKNIQEEILDLRSKIDGLDGIEIDIDILRDEFEEVVDKNDLRIRL